VLTAQLEAAHDESRGTYGAPHLHAELAENDIHVGKKRVARLMKAAGLVGISPRKSTFTTVRDADARPSADLVKRDFTASGPDQLWVADITYISTWAGFLYLAVVLDAWSRKVIGWAMSTTLHTDVVLEAHNMAVTQRQPRDVIHHSDHGCQLGFKWSSLQGGRRPAVDGHRRRRVRQRDVRELLRHARVRAARPSQLSLQAEARMAVFDYLEGFYNPRRRHSALDYKSPMEYERRHAPAA
jgi:putative transposase